MIEVIFTQAKDNETYVMKVKGHAGFADPGKDVVCAAVSTLVYTLAQNVSDFYSLGWLRKEPCLKLVDGGSKITCTPRIEHRNAAKLVFIAIQRGMEMLAINYPDFIGITKLVTDSRPSNIKKGAVHLTDRKDADYA